MADIKDVALELDDTATVREHLRKHKRAILDASGVTSAPMPASKKNLKYNKDALVCFAARMRTHAKKTAPCVPDISQELLHLHTQNGTHIDALGLHNETKDTKRALNKLRNHWKKFNKRPIKDRSLAVGKIRCVTAWGMREAGLNHSFSGS